MKAIAVIDKNLAIGNKGCLLCRIPTDLAQFKETTLGKTLIIGRKTLESLPGGKPLPGRNTIVLSRNADFTSVCDQGKFWSCILSSPKEVFACIEGKVEDSDIFVAGGEEIYRLFLKYCNELILTELDFEFEDVDAFFPEFRSDFELIQKGELKEDNGYFYRTNKYVRI